MVNIKLNREKIVSRKGMLAFIHELRKIFFKELFLDSKDNKHTKAKHLFLKHIDNDHEQMEIFFSACVDIKDQLYEDLEFFFQSDPAANSYEEIVTVYPGYIAIRFYRIAHQLYIQGYKAHARAISEEAHFKTGIDIHPGAKINYPFFIDHGTGIVIGETSLIGKNVKIYQGVTLGAKSLGQGAKLKDVKRHPTIGNNVTIYSNASILGGDVNIGDNVVIGSNVYIVSKSIEPNTTVILEEPKMIVREKKN